jgi:4a-hydroxytetrahydrobiopterin dehydratase
MGAVFPTVEHQVQHWARVERGDQAMLSRTFTFPDWQRALAFVNAVGALAEEQDHHPLVELMWGRVTLYSWTQDEGAVGPRDVRLCTAINALVP